MKRTLISCAVGVGLLAAALLPVVFHAQPGSPRPSALAATPGPAAASPAPQHFPRIDAAIHHLEEAKKELEAAPKEFHGHRHMAIVRVDQALDECHKAIAAGP
jgi:hypothetical protein